MMDDTSYNIIVAGLGGQGVNTLTRVLFELCQAHSLPAQGAVFKGGAQKAGTIHSEIRIFAAARDDHARHSNQILKGTLNLMLGLEPHEATRFASFFNAQTRLVLNDAPVPFYSERLTGHSPPDAVAVLKRRYRHVVARNFSEQAHREYGTRRMTNLLMLSEAADSEGFPFERTAVHRAFCATLGLDPGTPKITEAK
jgi:Pyruvate/2-oxoacid:ferredoxin oxidoreductase gamma subunit